MSRLRFELLFDCVSLHHLHLNLINECIGVFEELKGEAAGRCFSSAQLVILWLGCWNAATRNRLAPSHTWRWPPWPPCRLNPAAVNICRVCLGSFMYACLDMALLYWCQRKQVQSPCGPSSQQFTGCHGSSVFSKREREEAGVWFNHVTV